MISLLLLTAAAFAECERPSDASAISASASGAQLAMASLDLETVARTVADAKEALPCLALPINPLDAASYHALMGLDAFVAGRTDEATLSFQAAMAITPDFRLPAVVAPPGGPLDAILTDARGMTSLGAVPLDPFEGILLVDGVTSTTRPVDRPWILQLVTPQGRVTGTHYLQVADVLPHWDPPRTALQRIVPKVRKKPKVPFAIAAGTAAAAGITLYVLGGTWHGQYLDPATPYEDLDALRAQSDGALYASYGLGAIAIGFGTVTIFEW